MVRAEPLEHAGAGGSELESGVNLEKQAAAKDAAAFVLRTGSLTILEKLPAKPIPQS